ncbi:MAG: hypothetical protein NT162_03360 [Candidatus Woesebacteria bacterium]|nr:hypothetical protein [Candidatus Woesebacteria bacterium]
MSTINRELADELLKEGGKSKHGSAGYCLVRYQNRTKYDIAGVDLYDPDAKINCFDYAIFSNKRKYQEFMESDTVGGIDILWGSAGFYKDEKERELTDVDSDITTEMAFLGQEFEDDETSEPGIRER